MRTPETLLSLFNALKRHIPATGRVISSNTVPDTPFTACHPVHAGADNAGGSAHEDGKIQEHCTLPATAVFTPDRRGATHVPNSVIPTIDTNRILFSSLRESEGHSAQCIIPSRRDLRVDVRQQSGASSTKGNRLIHRSAPPAHTLSYLEQQMLLSQDSMEEGAVSSNDRKGLCFSRCILD